MGDKLRTRKREVRVWTAFVVMSWLLPLGLWTSERFFNAATDYVDQGITGPYAVEPSGKIVDGRTVYRAVAPIDAVPAGTRFGWISSVCLDAAKSMLARSDIVRLSDGVVVITGPHRFWTPEEKRCGPAVGTAIIPPDTKPGAYELRRTATLRPESVFPLNVNMVGLRFEIVGAGTKRAP